MSLKSLPWVAAFVVWLLVYLCFATAFGVMTLYVLVSVPSEPRAWINFGLWAAFAAIGGVTLVFLMKRAFEDRKTDA